MEKTLTMIFLGLAVVELFRPLKTQENVVTDTW